MTDSCNLSTYTWAQTPHAGRTFASSKAQPLPPPPYPTPEHLVPSCRSNSSKGRTRCINTFKGFTCECGAGYLKVTNKVGVLTVLHEFPGFVSVRHQPTCHHIPHCNLSYDMLLCTFPQLLLPRVPTPSHSIVGHPTSTLCYLTPTREVPYPRAISTH